MKRKRNKLIMLAVGILVVAALIVGGCVPAVTPPEVTPPEVAPPEVPAEPVVDVWEWSALVGRTGTWAFLEPEFVFGYETAVEEINAAGGLRGKPIELSYHDSGNDPSKSLAEMSKIVGDALVIFGPLSDIEGRAVLPLAVREGVYCLAVAMGSLVNLEFEPWTLSFIDLDERLSSPGPVWWARRFPEIKKVVSFVDPVHPVWMGMADTQEEALESEGVEIVGRVNVSGEEVDFGTIAVKALAFEPDGFIFTCSASAIPRVMVELQRRGFTDNNRMLLFGTAYTSDVFEMGEGIMEDAWHWSWVNPELETEAWLELKAAYEAEHPELPAPGFILQSA